MTTASKDLAIRTDGDPWIVGELERVRLTKRLNGGLPAFDRGLMFFDFDAGKISVAPVKGGA